MKYVLSFFTAVFSFYACYSQTTICPPKYKFACNNEDYIGNVGLGLIQNQTACPKTGNYELYSATTTLSIGTINRLTVQVGKSAQTVAAYIDFDGDGAFETVGEFYNLGVIPSGTASGINILVPEYAKSIVTLRIISTNASATLTYRSGDCNTVLDNGETEDYHLTITSKSNCLADIPPVISGKSNTICQGASQIIGSTYKGNY
ncbi:MAG TPA: GEVED domain-containing protein, partial [Cytophagaceae bacterium]